MVRIILQSSLAFTVLLLFVFSGCGGNFSPSPFFLADFPGALQKVCESKGKLEQPPDDGRWADETTPDYRNRTVVFNLAMEEDQVAPLFAELQSELQSEVLKMAQAGGATVTNPNSNEASSMSARESVLMRYRTNSRGLGSIHLNLRSGQSTLLRVPEFKGGVSTDTGAGGVSVELTLQESPAP